VALELISQPVTTAGCLSRHGRGSRPDNEALHGPV